MARPGLVRLSVSPSASVAKSASALQVRFAEALACGRRLWIRGRLTGFASGQSDAGKKRSRWSLWETRSRPAGPAPTIQLESRISGHVLETQIPLNPHGRFEATFEAALPVARRGWRIARNKVKFAEQSAEKCAAVLLPPENAVGALVVLLPLAHSMTSVRAPDLVKSKDAARLASVLRQLQRARSGIHAIYYLACVPAASEENPAELALALTTLDWPGGSFVLLPTEPGTASAAVAFALDRLRWLLAGALDIVLINMEPSMVGAVHAQCEPRPDRAPISQLIQPHDDPRKALGTAGALRVRIPKPSPLRRRDALAPRHPVVFCHGMLAFTTLSMSLPEDPNYFTHLRGFLQDRGIRALYPRVIPTGGIVSRAQQLKEQILAWSDEPVNIIAHSMGGLDARYLITHLGLAERVRSLTTVSTPHRGSYLVDWFVANFRQRVPLLLALEAIGVNVDGFEDCRPAACAAFNLRTPDMPGVQYFSFGGAVSIARVAPVLRRAWNLLTAVEGPNDGMVSVTSARWGKYLGTIHADHFAQTPDMAFVHPTESFDPLGFYFRLLEDLARCGF